MFVDDGRRSPAKSKTDEKRRADREAVKTKKKGLLEAGDASSFNTVQRLMRETGEVSEYVVFQAVKYCKEHNIEIICGPFEADPQLVYLELSGYTAATLPRMVTCFSLAP